jgi:NAD(P)-dependent dehydrogenase (short-subunit alcohol dehydrogenase family)
VSGGRLAGKAGLVTGAGAGLGRAVLHAIVAEGGCVVGLDRDAEGLEQTIAGAAGLPGRAVAQVGDVTAEADVVAAIERCVDLFDTFNILDNNAGVAVEARLHETTIEQWNLVCDVNLKGAFYGCKHGVLAMRRHGGGAIVNTGSIASLGGDPLLPAYSTTKAGLLGLTRSIATDYAGDGIRANAICPGDMLTPMLERSFARAPDPAAFRLGMERAYPLKRIADPAEVAAAVVFLITDEASFITGSSLVVDGGLKVILY